MNPYRARLVSVAMAVMIGSGAAVACGSDDAAPDHTSADAVFIAAMQMHHQRAIEVGRLAADAGSDRRVREFGALIVSQQTPELTSLRGWARDIPARTDVAMSTPDGYIDDGTLARLRGERGVVFDRDVLLASAASETGAAAMARRELASGSYEPARTLATSIATAPTSQIPKLKELAAALGG